MHCMSCAYFFAFHDVLIVSKNVSKRPGFCIIYKSSSTTTFYESSRLFALYETFSFVYHIKEVYLFNIRHIKQALRLFCRLEMRAETSRLQLILTFVVYVTDIE